MTQPKISVIVPVYNQEQHLAQTLALLLAQTHRHLEIILVDDGSTDATPALCDRMAATDPRIVVLHTEHRGASAARNAGLQAASGAYVGFCDGDDLPEKDLYEYLLRLLMEADADISVCGVRTCYEDGRRPSRQKGCDAVFHSAQEALGSLLDMNMSISLNVKLFRAEVIQGLRLPEDIRLREDEYFTHMAFTRARRIACGAQAKYTYVRRNGSLSMTAFSEKYFDILQVCDRLREEVGVLYPALRPRYAAKKLKELMHLYKLMILRRAGAPFQAEADAICRQIRHGDWSAAVKYLSRNDRIRYALMKCSRHLYRLVVKLYDQF